MLIKYYTNTFPDTLHIIDNISNVSAPSNLAENPYSSAIPTNLTAYNYYDGEEDLSRKIIYFIKNGVPSFLFVYGRAYICNDDGKTIEKVSCLG